MSAKPKFHKFFEHSNLFLLDFRAFCGELAFTAAGLYGLYHVWLLLTK